MYQLMNVRAHMQTINHDTNNNNVEKNKEGENNSQY